MSERPTTQSTQFPITTPRWDRRLWGTEIRFGSQGDKLVIDKHGNAQFTDAGGETGVWDERLAGWVDPSSAELMHGQFGPPGFDLSAEELETAALKLDALVSEYEGMGDSSAAEPLKERAAALHEEAKAALGEGEFGPDFGD